MSCIAINHINSQHPNLTLLKLSANLAIQTIYAGVLTISSVALQIFSKIQSQTLLINAKNRFYTALNNLGLYFTYRKGVINFSKNHIDSLPKTIKGEVELRSHYGDKIIDEFIPNIDQNLCLNLDNLKLESDGFCYGMTLEFFDNFFQALSLCEAKKETAFEFFLKCVHSPSPKAQVAQMIYNTPFNETNKTLIEISNRNIQAIVDRIIDKPSITDGMSLESPRLRRWIRNYSFNFAVQSHICSFYSFEKDLKDVECFFYKNDTQSDCDRLQNKIEQLSDGAWQLQAGWLEGEGHALGLIKSKSCFYLFDPNYGLLKLDSKNTAYHLSRCYGKFAESFLDLTPIHRKNNHA